MSTVEYIRLMQTGILHSVGVCLLFALAAYACGCIVSRRRDFIAFALGVFLTGSLWFLLFSFFSFSTAVPTAVCLVCTMALPGVWFLGRAFYRRKALLLSGIILFTLFVASALLPPYSWDEQVYQVELLSRYCRNGSAAVLADNSYSAWPGFLQGFCLPGFITGGLNFPRLFNTLLTVTIAGALFAFLRRYGRWTAGVLTAAAVLSPLTLILTRSVYAENMTALFAAAGFFSLYRLRKDPFLACLFCGIFSGALVAVKLTAGGTALALFLLCAMARRNRKYLWVFFAGAAAAVFPWLFRIWFYCGNPVYPFASRLFGTSQAVEECHRMLGDLRYGLGAWPGVLYAWICTAFYRTGFDGVITGLQQLVFYGIIFAAWYYRRFTGRMRLILPGLGALLVLYLFWAFTSQQSRFLYPAFLLLTLPAAWALRSLPRKAQRIFLLAVLGGTFLTSGMLPHIKHFLISWRITTPVRKDPLRFLGFAQNDPGFIQILEAIGRTPEKSRILLLFEKRGLYIPRHHEIADPGFQEKYFLRIPETPEEFMAELKDADYLLFGSNERNVDLQEKEILIQRHLSALAVEAINRGWLQLAASGNGNSCHLLKINRLTK